MDYPAPLVQIRGGRLDLSDAYGRGIGAFDAFSVRYGYSQFAPGRQRGRRPWPRSCARACAPGCCSCPTSTRRDPGTAHPLGAVWDNGADPLESLRHEIEVRRIALERFGLANLRPGPAPLGAGAAAPAPLPPPPIPARGRAEVARRRVLHVRGARGRRTGRGQGACRTRCAAIVAPERGSARPCGWP